MPARLVNADAFLVRRAMAVRFESERPAKAGGCTMNRAWFAMVSTTALALAISSSAVAAQIRIGVGALGPISPKGEYRIQQAVGSLPNIDVVPIVPPGGVDACVKRFVAGEPGDRLDGVMVVSVPTGSFKAVRGSKEATFSGTYQIWLLNLSTLAEDRHAFTFQDQEPVVGGVSALLAMPAELLSERSGNGRLVSGDVYQAYQSIQSRVESKMVAATKLYLTTSPIRGIGPLNALECARKLVQRGDAETAMAVFKSVGVDSPQVKAMMARAQKKLMRAEAEKLLGQTLGAIAGDNPGQANALVEDYAKAPASDPSQVQAVRGALTAFSPPAAKTSLDSLLRHDVPGLDHAAFLAMVERMFSDETGSKAATVQVLGSQVVVEDGKASDGLKTHVDTYARALGQSARLMSLRCGCGASATLVSGAAGQPLLKARFEPSFKQPKVGLP